MAQCQLALLYRLTQRNQFTIGLSGALGGLRAIDLGFATSDLLAPGLRLQPDDQLALRIDFAACEQLGLLQGLSQRRKFSMRLVGRPGRLVAMRGSLLG